MVEMPNCWRCGQPLSHPDSRFCDRCGASVTSSGGANAINYDERADFDRNVALLFAITGVSAIVIGVVGGFAFLSLMEGFPAVGAYSALAVIGGLAVGAVFLYLAYRIRNKM
ncbi:MAG: zinc ribbon domain-containing protein [Methanomassiliicoccales archaeon]|nr:zinc ribbon domain-containing protein [Methanomassiliicoccales archaeon]